MHELTHAADSSTGEFTQKLSKDPAWGNVIDPRVDALRRMLKEQQLTPSVAAAMDFSDARKNLESSIRDVTGLPSALSGEDHQEAMAEIVSFWINEYSHYRPPPEVADFLRVRLFGPNP